MHRNACTGKQTDIAFYVCSKPLLFVKKHLGSLCAAVFAFFKFLSDSLLLSNDNYSNMYEVIQGGTDKNEKNQYIGCPRLEIPFS